MEPLITNERGEREWQWIVAQVGEAAAVAAIDRLGNRKPYPLNIAKALGLTMPENVSLPSKETVAKRLDDLRAILKK